MPDEYVEFIAVMHIRLNGKNTRVQRDEIEKIFEKAKEVSNEMNIDADLVFFDR